jgi:predicted dithiol-disulfide oxidoreductase (DUF899 family)
MPGLLSDRRRLQRAVVHLENHDVAFTAVSRAPLDKLQAYKRRMGWSFPWASSFRNDFNYDFNTSVTEEQQSSGIVEYNFRGVDVRPSLEAGKEGPLAEIAAGLGTDWATYTREAPGMSAFALDDGVVYHTYSAYARGLDGLWGMYQWLDRAPRGETRQGRGSGSAATTSRTAHEQLGGRVAASRGPLLCQHARQTPNALAPSAK